MPAADPSDPAPLPAPLPAPAEPAAGALLETRFLLSVFAELSGRPLPPRRVGAHAGPGTRGGEEAEPPQARR